MNDRWLYGKKVSNWKKVNPLMQGTSGSGDNMYSHERKRSEQSTYQLRELQKSGFVTMSVMEVRAATKWQCMTHGFDKQSHALSKQMHLRSSSPTIDRSFSLGTVCTIIPAVCTLCQLLVVLHFTLKASVSFVHCVNHI